MCRTVTFGLPIRFAAFGCEIVADGSLWCWGDHPLTSGGYLGAPSSDQVDANTDWLTVSSGPVLVGALLIGTLAIAVGLPHITRRSLAPQGVVERLGGFG